MLKIYLMLKGSLKPTGGHRLWALFTTDLAALVIAQFCTIDRRRRAGGAFQLAGEEDKILFQIAQDTVGIGYDLEIGREPGCSESCESSM
jgi:hypothetical protein